MRETPEALDAFERRLAEALGGGEGPPPAVEARALRMARAELAASRGRAWRGEFARLLAALALPLALVVLWNFGLVATLAPLLESLLPELLARSFVGFYLVGVAGWLALLLMALPSLAHHLAIRRLAAVEVSPWT